MMGKDEAAPQLMTVRAFVDVKWNACCLLRGIFLAADSRVGRGWGQADARPQEFHALAQKAVC